MEIGFRKIVQNKKHEEGEKQGLEGRLLIIQAGFAKYFLPQDGLHKY